MDFSLLYPTELCGLATLARILHIFGSLGLCKHRKMVFPVPLIVLFLSKTQSPHRQ